MQPIPDPGTVRAVARDDMIMATMTILQQVQENGLIGVPEHHLRTAAAQIFDKLSHYALLKILAGMATPMMSPTAPETTP